MNELAKRGYTPMPSLIRDFFKQTNRTEADQNNMPIEEVWELQKSIFDWKVEYDRLEHEGETVYDRTLLDHYIYCLQRCGHIIPPSIEAAMHILVSQNLNRYTHLFYFPNNLLPNREDGFRQIGTIQRAQDLMIRGFLNEIPEEREIPLVPMGTVEERIDYILKAVKVVPPWVL